MNRKTLLTPFFVAAVFVSGLANAQTGTVAIEDLSLVEENVINVAAPSWPHHGGHGHGGHGGHGHGGHGHGGHGHGGHGHGGHHHHGHGGHHFFGHHFNNGAAPDSTVALPEPNIDLK